MGPALIILFAVLWAAGWIVAARIRRPAALPGTVNPAHASVVVPARDEERNLPRLLDSLSRQSARPLEIIVVDDGSADRTAGLAAGMGARVIVSRPLPDGWRGKTWACHQGGLAARGERLMFMDADTWFEPGGLETACSLFPEGVLSISPYHAVEKANENLSLFFNICMTAGTVPDGLAGPFLLLGRDHYERIGGHGSVRGKVLENFHMAAGFHAAGIPVRCVPGKGIVSIRMYPDGWRDMVEGWTKGFAAGAGGTRRAVMLVVVAWMVALVLAPLAGLLTGEWWRWGPAYAACVAQVAWIGRRLGSFGLPAILVYPVPLLFFFGLFAWSAMRSGKRVTWKGRDIHAD